MSVELPDLAQVLGPLLARVTTEQQPLLLAAAERLAAERYRGWASQAKGAERAGFLACAAREEEIARRVESLYTDVAATERAILAAVPDLLEINRTLFAPYPLAQQLLLQSRGERLGAMTWRRFAAGENDPERRQTFLGCALLEEESAAFLEALSPGIG